MRKSVAAALGLGVLLCALASWLRWRYRHPRVISAATIRRVLAERPAAVIPGSLRTFVGIYCEIQHGVIAGPEGVPLGEGQPASRPDRFWVRTADDRERRELIERLHAKGHPPNNGKPGSQLSSERWGYRALFVAGGFSLALALLLVFEDRRRRSEPGLPAAALEARTWWREWRRGMAVFFGALVLAAGGMPFLGGSSLWTMLPPMLFVGGLSIVGVIGLGVGGIAGVWRLCRWTSAA